MHASSKNMQTFQDRVARIKDPRFTHVVDPESGMKIPRRLGRDQVGNKKMQSGPAMLFMAAMLGAICLMFARYLRMEVIDVAPYFPNGMVAELSMAVMAAVVIGGFMRMQNVRLMAVQAVGALACCVLMHNAVWVAPDQFASIFSQGYVNQILAQTEPLSIFVNGMSFTLTI
ncbi:MAG: hypothetical protein AAFP98_09455 [Pseudomonadota bacterium]